MARVLIADDHAGIRRLLALTLAVDHHDVLEAADGSEALALLREHRPDVAILDVVMPGVDGLSVCRTAREDRRLRDVRIIILSATAVEEDARRAGADRYVDKPFRPVMLLELVADLAGAPRRSSDAAPLPPCDGLAKFPRSIIMGS